MNCPLGFSLSTICMVLLVQLLQELLSRLFCLERYYNNLILCRLILKSRFFCIVSLMTFNLMLYSPRTHCCQLFYFLIKLSGLVEQVSIRYVLSHTFPVQLFFTGFCDTYWNKCLETNGFFNRTKSVLI